VENGGMKKTLLVLVAAISIYFGSGIVSAFLLEHKAESYMQLALEDISSPWSVDKLNSHASIWLLKKAKLTPQKIVDLSNQDLGNLLEFNRAPDCILQQGMDFYSATKHTYAICINDAKFEKQSVKLKIRLIVENNKWKINDFISIN
jgi:hypothetical protein